jgi:cytidine deaminase
MREFCSDDFEIIVGSSENNLQVITLKELLPFSFSAEDIK